MEPDLHLWDRSQSEKFTGNQTKWSTLCGTAVFILQIANRGFTPPTCMGCILVRLQNKAEAQNGT